MVKDIEEEERKVLKLEAKDWLGAPKYKITFDEEIYGDREHEVSSSSFHKLDPRKYAIFRRIIEKAEKYDKKSMEKRIVREKREGEDIMG